MSATTRGRRSDALYFGGTTRRDLCDMVARLEEKNKAKVIGEDADAAFLSDTWGAAHRCGNCGSAVCAGDRFCSRCGAELEWGER